MYLSDKEVVKRIIGRMKSEDVVKYFVLDEEIPFEYSMMMVEQYKDKDYFNDDLAYVIRRKDCPEDVALDICRIANNSIIFVKTVLYDFKEQDEYDHSTSFSVKWEEARKVPESVQRAIFMKKNSADFLKWAFAGYWRLADSLKKTVADFYMDSIVSEKEYYRNSKNVENLFHFVRTQPWLPKECLGRLIELGKKKFYHQYIMGGYDRMLEEDISLMKEPLSDKQVDEVMDRTWHHFSDCAKIVANASVTNYGLMQVMTKCPAEYAEDLNKLIEKRKEARDEYRRKHKCSRTHGES